MTSSKLTPPELLRYSRHLVLPEIKTAGQLKLKQARVLVVGAGGLGCPILLYLSAAGVGQLGLIDDDVIETSNLQRQVLYTVNEVGLSKALVAGQKLKALNPFIKIDSFQERLSKDNVLTIFRNFDLVIDGSDNFTTRYLVNDACIMMGIPMIYGSVYRFEGQVSVFNLTDHSGGKGPTYRDVFPEPPPPELATNCAEGGVLGVLPGMVGSIQANEAIKIITGIGKTLSGYLYLVNALDYQHRKIKIRANPVFQKIETLKEYDQYCGSLPAEKLKQLSPSQLNDMIKQGRSIQIFDVRDPAEYEMGHLKAQLVDPRGIDQWAPKINRDQVVVFYCRSGQRSRAVIVKLQQKFGLENLYNLDGGLLAYAQQIDPTLQVF
ncbi:MAG: molybdopterin-synthase adenylyltransferase MoeB [Candidatus Cyclobacteriaceae bacterium M3_2C_046]